MPPLDNASEELVAQQFRTALVLQLQKELIDYQQQILELPVQVQNFYFKQREQQLEKKLKEYNAPTR